ncbi:MAG TPA: GNAT family N-acetyltransferase [Hyphomicrobium sp.]|nr:GNAT family N-acetyltransferase [Hyphomicrobium sp.]
MNTIASSETWSHVALQAEGMAACRFTIDILTSMESAAPVWLELERGGALASPYQRYAWASSWQETIGQAEGATPFIVVGRDHAGTAAFLWPLCRTRLGPLSIARFLGGKHSNANFPLWRPEVASGVTGADVRAALDDVARSEPSVDMLVLLNQPKSWSFVANPLAHLPHDESPSKICHSTLPSDFEAFYRERVSSSTRRKMRQKERALAKHGAVSYWRARTKEDVRRVLEAFFAQKAERMRQLGIANAFAEPGAREFIELAAVRPDPNTGVPPIELYVASVGDCIVATFAGVVSDRRFCGMFNSMIMNELSNESPGELLLANVVRMACERGLSAFDLGIGEASYKRTFCNETDTLFDTVVPLSVRGKLVTPLWRGQLNVKRRIKHSLYARQTVEALRRHLLGESRAGFGTAEAAKLQSVA